MIAGLCAGIARTLDVDPVIVRVVAVLLTIVSGGLAAVAYVVAWPLVPFEGEEGAASGPSARAAGGASRRSRRGARSAAVSSGVGLAALTVLLVFRELGLWWSDAFVWPLVIAAAGAALIWRQSLAGDARDPSEAGTADASQGSRLASVYRGGFGVALVIGAVLLFLYFTGALDAAGDAALGALAVLVGLGLVLAPLWWRLGRDLFEERSRRIRTAERAEMAAHLHDSVLQTLAMVQRSADDPRAVASLARRQERELRAWISGREPKRAAASVAEALEAIADTVERERSVRVEVVSTGDAPLSDERQQALLGAAREAILNAAKFAGEDGPIDVFCEATGGGVEIFVRDRGPGFDPAAVPAERHGVRESIVARVERHGGEAAIRSGRGRGTEVRLAMPGADS